MSGRAAVVGDVDDRIGTTARPLALVDHRDCLLPLTSLAQNAVPEILTATYEANLALKAHQAAEARNAHMCTTGPLRLNTESLSTAHLRHNRQRPRRLQRETTRHLALHRRQRVQQYPLRIPLLTNHDLSRLLHVEPPPVHHMHAAALRLANETRTLRPLQVLGPSADLTVLSGPLLVLVLALHTHLVLVLHLYELGGVVGAAADASSGVVLLLDSLDLGGEEGCRVPEL